MILFVVFFQMLALLIMIGAGFFLAKKNILDEHTNTRISSMIVTIFNPLLVLSSAFQAAESVSIRTMGQISLVAVGMFVIFIVCGMILAPRFSRDLGQRRIYQMMFVFSNLGFIGIPVVSSILGEEYVVYVTEFILIYTLVFYTYGVALMDGKFSFSSLRAILNPGTVAGAAAVLVVVFRLPVPSFLETAATYLGNAASPLALVSVGFSLAHSDLKKVFGQPRLYVFSLLKLLVLPLAMLPLLRLFLPDPALIPVCMVMFGMPVGNLPLILANQKGIDGTTCSAAIILSTILCVFTVPILIAAI